MQLSATRWALWAYAAGPNRRREAAFAFSASASRLRGGMVVVSSPNNPCTTRAISSTAPSNAAWLAYDGLLKPVTLRTNCRAAASISSSVAGGSKWYSGLMFRHMALCSLPLG